MTAEALLNTDYKTSHTNPKLLMFAARKKAVNTNILHVLWPTLNILFVYNALDDVHPTALEL